MVSRCKRVVREGEASAEPAPGNPGFCSSIHKTARHTVSARQESRPSEIYQESGWRFPVLHALDYLQSLDLEQFLEAPAISSFCQRFKSVGENALPAADVFGGQVLANRFQSHLRPSKPSREFFG